MNDASTTLAELTAVVQEFVDQRDWQQFHTPKNLAMSLAIEVAELMEHFQWIDGAASRRVVDDAPKRGEVADELADVLCYTLALANQLGIDLSASFEAKMVKNRAKYPAEQYRGRYGPKDDGNG
jgi:dCTP diphosphatase